jgi:hypothetical protein
LCAHPPQPHLRCRIPARDRPQRNQALIAHCSAHTPSRPIPGDPSSPQASQHRATGNETRSEPPCCLGGGAVASQCHGRKQGLDYSGIHAPAPTPVPGTFHPVHKPHYHRWSSCHWRPVRPQASSAQLAPQDMQTRRDDWDQNDPPAVRGPRGYQMAGLPLPRIRILSNTTQSMRVADTGHFAPEWRSCPNGPLRAANRLDSGRATRVSLPMA